MSGGAGQSWVRTIAVIPCLLTLLSSGPARAQDVDRYVQTQMERLHLPGVSLAVVRGGRLLKAQGYGFADLELKARANPATVYEIGSNTKQFTAAAVMMLVEEGKVSLDDSITRYFPEAPRRWSRITVRHLLNHTSGIQNHVAVPGFARLFRTNLLLETVPTRAELLKMFFGLPLEFQPGETWAYDNTGYYLLGILIEKVSGRSYWQFLEHRIFEPLGMTATRNTDVRPIVSNRASGYEWINDTYENRPVLGPSIGFSAGSLLSTVEDMARWDIALRGERLLKGPVLELMWTPARTGRGDPAPFSYGLGWFVDGDHGRRIVLHSGGTPGFSSVIHRYVDDDITVILLTNHSDRILDQMAREIAGMYVPTLRRPETAPDPDPDMSRRLRDLTASLLEGRHDPELLTRPMQIFLKTATGTSFWKWFASNGAMGAFTLADHEVAREGRVLRYRIILGGNPFWLSFCLGRDGKIAGIHWW